jgi:hypothetical protein
MYASQGREIAKTKADQDLQKAQNLIRRTEKKEEKKKKEEADRL